MKKKQKSKIIGTIIKVFGVLLIVYMACAGKYIEDGLGYRSQIYLYGLIDFLILVFVYIIVPVILRIKNKQKFSYEKGIRICRWNFFGYLMLFAVLDTLNFGGIYDEVFVNMGSNMVYGFFLYYINKLLLIDESKTDKKEKTKKKKTNKKNNKWEINLCTNCYAKVKETDEFCPKCGNAFKDTTQVYENNEVVVTENIVNDSIKVQSKTRYCKYCGGKINADKKCTKCGKQYFHIKSKSTLVLIPISILLIVSIILNIKFYKENEILSDDNWNLYMENNSLESQLTNIDDGNEYYYVKNKIQFFDDYIVIVPDNSKYYYSYDCYEQKYPNSSFYAYNVSNAEAQGYKKGTC